MKIDRTKLCLAISLLLFCYCSCFVFVSCFPSTPFGIFSFGSTVSRYIFGMVLFRITNIEKHLFRDHMNNGGTVDKYRSPLSTRILAPVFKSGLFVLWVKRSLLKENGFWVVVGDMVPFRKKPFEIQQK